MKIPRIITGNKREKNSFVTFAEKKDEFNRNLPLPRKTRHRSSRL
jgi:hypothetical protein